MGFYPYVNHRHDACYNKQWAKRQQNGCTVSWCTRRLDRFASSRLRWRFAPSQAQGVAAPHGRLGCNSMRKAAVVLHPSRSSLPKPPRSVQFHPWPIEVLPVRQMPPPTNQKHHKVPKATNDPRRGSSLPSEAAHGRPQPSEASQAYALLPMANLGNPYPPSATAHQSRRSKVMQGHRTPSQASLHHPKLGRQAFARARTSYHPAVITDQIQKAATIEMLLRMYTVR